MRSSCTRLLALGLAAAVAALGVAAVAFGAGGVAGTTSKVKPKLKVNCPKRVSAGGKRVICRVVGKLPRGPRGRPGSQGNRGAKGSRGVRGPQGARGPAGALGMSGYEVVRQTFEGVLVANSDSERGLSDVKAVACPGGKRVLGGGADLGTGEGQAAEQRDVTVSLSGPNGTGSAWSVQLFNSSDVDLSIDVRVYAICSRAD